MHHLVNRAKNSVAPADTRPNLLIVCLGMAVRVKVGQRCQQRATIPDSVSLLLVGDHVHVNASGPHVGSRSGLAGLDPLVDYEFQILLKTSSKVFEHCRASGKDDILVKSTTDIDGRRLNRIINDSGQRGEKVAGVNLGVEEDLWREESLEANIDRVLPSSDAVLAVVSLEVFVRVQVVLSELFDNILANVRIVLLDGLGDLELVFWWDVYSLSSLTSRFWTKAVMSRPAMGMCLMEEPMT